MDQSDAISQTRKLYFSFVQFSLMGPDEPDVVDQTLHPLDLVTGIQDEEIILNIIDQTLG